MSVFDKIIQDKEEHEKFLGYAEKATTEARRIELCKKYLEAKKELPEWTLQPIMKEQHVIYANADTITMSSVHPEYKIQVGYEKNIVMAAIRKDLVYSISEKLIAGGYISFREDYRAYEQDYLFTAKLRIYKEPNNGK